MTLTFVCDGVDWTHEGPAYTRNNCQERFTAEALVTVKRNGKMRVDRSDLCHSLPDGWSLEQKDEYNTHIDGQYDDPNACFCPRHKVISR